MRDSWRDLWLQSPSIITGLEKPVQVGAIKGKRDGDRDEGIDRYNRPDNYVERNYIKRKASITHGYYNIDSALMIH